MMGYESSTRSSDGVALGFAFVKDRTIKSGKNKGKTQKVISIPSMKLMLIENMGRDSFRSKKKGTRAEFVVNLYNPEIGGTSPLTGAYQRKNKGGYVIIFNLGLSTIFLQEYRGKYKTKNKGITPDFMVWGNKRK